MFGIFSKNGELQRMKSWQDAIVGAELMEVAPKESGLPGEAWAVRFKGEDVTGFDFSEAPKEPSKDLQVYTLIEGEGPAIPDSPTYVTFNYFGSVWGSKKPFDESYSGEPAEFPPVAVSQPSARWERAGSWSTVNSATVSGEKILAVSSVPPRSLAASWIAATTSGWAADMSLASTRIHGAYSVDVRPIMSLAAASKHLKVLEGAGLVSHRSVGTKNLYALAPDGLHEAANRAGSIEISCNAARPPGASDRLIAAR